MIPVTSLLKIIVRSDLQICKKFYNLYYVYTRNFFILSFIVSVTNQFIGDASIYCNLTHEATIPKDMALSFCYLNGTYTVHNNVKFYHHYYKWISLILISEGFLFYMPFLIWANFNQSYIEGITSDKNKNPSQLNENKCKYILSTIKYSNLYFYCKHLILEFTFFANTIIQFIALDFLLNFKYFTFDFDILFPYQTTCNIDVVGYGGTNTTLKVLCYLPLNIVYSKLFQVIYVWFCFLLISNVCYIIFDTIYMIKNKKKLTCDQWVFYKIIKWNVIGKDRDYIINQIDIFI